jgi:hypothetical protein
MFFKKRLKLLNYSGLGISKTIQKLIKLCHGGIPMQLSFLIFRFLTI